MTSLDEINAAGRLLNPDGWIDLTALPTAEVASPTYLDKPRACCGQPAGDHPRSDSTMHGQCYGPHDGVEVSMHWNGRSYVCGLCALDAFHGGSA